ncbi:MAG: hypothetical protein RLZZ297_1744 [Chloroflexota bacterium]
MDIRFTDKTVIVTGAAHGFGRAIARTFAARGAHVWACDLVADEIAETQALCRAAGGVCTGVTVDVTQPAQVQAFVAQALAAAPTKQIDVLVNNAGGVLGQVGQPLEQVTFEQWNAILAVNLSAAFYFAQAVAPSMKQARSGRIINISSGAGLGPSLTGIQAYASAKAGQINLTRQLCHELGPYGITANNIAPGFVLSNANTQRQWESYSPETQKNLVASIALQRLGQPDDIAHAVLFLASEYAGWISGQVIGVDGGK